MLFILNMDVSLPGTMDEMTKSDLRSRENDQAIALIKEGRLVKIWRIVGQTANYSLWEAPTLEALHAAISSLPMFPFMKVDVTPLIQHPVTDAWEKANQLSMQ